MKTTKITIKNLFGIRETTLDGKSVEISGPKGSGKTSVLDAIRYALTNRSDRDYIVHQGAMRAKSSLRPILDCPLTGRPCPPSPPAR